jgi:hypothetical protein
MNGKKAKALRRAAGFKPKEVRAKDLFAAPGKRPFEANIAGSPRRVYQDAKGAK